MPHSNSLGHENTTSFFDTSYTISTHSLSALVRYSSRCPIAPLQGLAQVDTRAVAHANGHLLSRRDRSCITDPHTDGVKRVVDQVRRKVIIKAILRHFSWCAAGPRK